jgi:hypothetical protein
MFDKYKKPESFYKAYDLISDVFPFHAPLFSFLRGKFKNITSKESAHIEIIKSFVEYFYTTIFEGNPLAEQQLKRFGPLYHEIFSCCYEERFETKPGAKHDVMNKLSDPKSRKLFENVEKIKSSNNDVKPEEFELIKNQFIFIREFSKFIRANRDKEPLDYFKRFFNDFDFESKGMDCTQNLEWQKEHQAKFEIIKQDNQANDNDFIESRKWFEKQLYKVNFNALCEKDKAIFILEMFIAFGNISDDDTGSIKGFVRPLKNTFFLGRYYNVHSLSLQYINWTDKLHVENKKKIQQLAYETKRKFCGLSPVSPQTIKKAKDDGLRNLAIEPGAQKARRVDLNRLETQEPIPATLKATDGISEQYNKVINNFSIFEISKAAPNKQSTLNCVLSVFDRVGLSASIKEESNENIESISKTLTRLRHSPFLQDLVAGSATKIGTSKFSFGLVTHYEKYKAGDFFSSPSNLSLDDVMNNLLNR